MEFEIYRPQLQKYCANATSFKFPQRTKNQMHIQSSKLLLIYFRFGKRNTQNFSFLLIIPDSHIRSYQRKTVVRLSCMSDLLWTSTEVFSRLVPPFRFPRCPLALPTAVASWLYEQFQRLSKERRVPNSADLHRPIIAPLLVPRVHVRLFGPCQPTHSPLASFR